MDGWRFIRAVTVIRLDSTQSIDFGCRKKMRKQSKSLGSLEVLFLFRVSIASENYFFQNSHFVCPFSCLCAVLETDFWTTGKMKNNKDNGGGKR